MGSVEPIGIFDSGIGGLTVFQAIRKRYPLQNVVYFGDTARVPYGNRDQKAIVDSSLRGVDFLTQFPLCALVIACHTASAYTLHLLQRKLSIPVIGVVEPAIREACLTTQNQKIALLATPASVRSGTHRSCLKALRPDAELFPIPSQSLVSLIEGGWQDPLRAERLLKELLTPAVKRGCDTLILGCTHFPLIRREIQKSVGDEVALIDPSLACATELSFWAANEGEGSSRFFVSDAPEKFSVLAAKFLNIEVSCVEQKGNAHQPESPSPCISF